MATAAGASAGRILSLAAEDVRADRNTHVPRTAGVFPLPLSGFGASAQAVSDARFRGSHVKHRDVLLEQVPVLPTEIGQLIVDCLLPKVDAELEGPYEFHLNHPTLTHSDETRLRVATVLSAEQNSRQAFRTSHFSAPLLPGQSFSFKVRFEGVEESTGGILLAVGLTMTAGMQSCVGWSKNSWAFTCNKLNKNVEFQANGRQVRLDGEDRIGDTDMVFGAGNTVAIFINRSGPVQDRHISMSVDGRGVVGTMSLDCACEHEHAQQEDAAAATPPSNAGTSLEPCCVYSSPAFFAVTTWNPGIRFSLEEFAVVLD